MNFNVHEGEILALLGRNGAGKTSTLRAIARLDNPQVTHGEIWLDHQPLHRMKSHEASQAGLSLVPEDRRIIPGLTVEENIQLAQIAPPIGWSLERIYELFPRLGERRKQEGVDAVGAGEAADAVDRAGGACAATLQGFLGFSTSPMRASPPVIVETRSKRHWGTSSSSRGITTILGRAETRCARPEACDRAVILESGEVVFDGTADEVLHKEQLRHALPGDLGTDPLPLQPRRPGKALPPAMAPVPVHCAGLCTAGPATRCLSPVVRP